MARKLQVRLWGKQVKPLSRFYFYYFGIMPWSFRSVVNSGSNACILSWGYLIIIEACGWFFLGGGVPFKTPSLSFTYILMPFTTRAYVLCMPQTLLQNRLVSSQQGTHLPGKHFGTPVSQSNCSPLGISSLTTALKALFAFWLQGASFLMFHMTTVL